MERELCAQELLARPKIKFIDFQVDLLSQL